MHGLASSIWWSLDRFYWLFLVEVIENKPGRGFHAVRRCQPGISIKQKATKFMFSNKRRNPFMRRWHTTKLTWFYGLGVWNLFWRVFMCICRGDFTYSLELDGNSCYKKRIKGKDNHGMRRRNSDDPWLYEIFWSLVAEALQVPVKTTHP